MAVAHVLQTSLVSAAVKSMLKEELVTSVKMDSMACQMRMSMVWLFSLYVLIYS